VLPVSEEIFVSVGIFTEKVVKSSVHFFIMETLHCLFTNENVILEKK
jgi:hypothetical protein